VRKCERACYGQLSDVRERHDHDAFRSSAPVPTRAATPSSATVVTVSSPQITPAAPPGDLPGRRPTAPIAPPCDTSGEQSSKVRLASCNTWACRCGYMQHAHAHAHHMMRACVCRPLNRLKYQPGHQEGEAGNGGRERREGTNDRRNGGQRHVGALENWHLNQMCPPLPLEHPRRPQCRCLVP